MAIKHIKDGADFEFSKDFGFHGSANGTGKGEHHSGYKRGGHAMGGSTQGPDEPDTHDSGDSVEDSHRYAKGGHAGEEGAEIDEDEGKGFMSEPGQDKHKMARGGGMPMHATGAHPHGHHVTHVSSMHDGSEIHHHAHGGFTIHHARGGMTHCAAGGHPVGHGGGDEAQDKAMIKSAFSQHEDAEHGGEHEDLKLARGGMTVPNQRMPHGMKPHAMHRGSPIGAGGGGGMNDGNPNRMPTPRGAMPGGTMPMGVQPSDEPDTAGSDQTGLGGAMMKKGGHHRG